MAKIIKLQSHSVGRLFLHNNRSPDDGVEHSNEDIDLSRTHLNYAFKSGGVDEMRKRLDEVFSIRRKNNQVLLCEVVVTLPKDAHSEDEHAFFEGIYDFYSKDFGEKNIINAVVHKDENTPHIHLDFVPVVTGDFEYSSSGYGKHLREELDKWKETHPGPLERLSCADVVTRPYLRQMHERLFSFMEKRLGYPVSILNGATANGNKKILELKVARLEAENKRLEQQQKFLSEDVQNIMNLCKKTGISTENVDLLPLMQNIAELQLQNQILQGIIRRNEYTYSRDDLEAFKERIPQGAKSISVNVINKPLSSAALDKQAVVILETYDRIPRKQPQELFLQQHKELWALMNEAKQYPGRVVKKRSSSGKTVVVLKADNELQTVETLLELERLLRDKEFKDRKVYMSKLEYDRFHIARSVLKESYTEAYYYIGLEKETSTDEKIRQRY